jgi:CemA family
MLCKRAAGSSCHRHALRCAFTLLHFADKYRPHDCTAAAAVAVTFTTSPGWTGLIDLVLGHYGIEVEEENIVLFVGIIPIAIDVLFKYWIFIGLNRISPGAVVTIKQLDRH